MEIRKYSEADKIQLIKLFEQFQDYLIYIDPIKRLRRMPGYGEYQVQKTLDDVKNKDGLWLLAVVNDAVVGFIVGLAIMQDKEERLYVQPSLIGRITELYLDAEYRGKGIGRKLMEEMEKYLKEKGCDVIRIEVFVPNAKAHNFYEKFGYTDRDIDMIKKI